MGRTPPNHELGARERQILDVIFRLGEASVGGVLKQLPSPPSYSSVRTMIRLLEGKGLLKHRVDGAKYVYRPTQSHETASKSALTHVLKTFFRDSATDAVAAILHVSSAKLTEDDLVRMEQLIERAKQQGE